MNEQKPQPSRSLRPRKPHSFKDSLKVGNAIGLGLWFVYFFITQTSDNFDRATTGLQSLAESLISR